jgi:DNA polymerase-3 subunit gamma/tau
MLTKEAFNALLKTLEEPPSHVIFLFATTEPHKVLPTILSRCQRFQLNRIPLNTIIEKLLTITKDLKVEAEPKALHLIATRSEGGLRDAESLLDQMISFNGGKLTEESVAKSLGLLPKNLFFELDFAGKEGNLAKAFEISEAIFSEGKDFIYFVESYAEHFRILLEIKLSEGIPEHLSLLKEEHKRYLESAALYSKETLLYILESVVNGMIEIRSAPNSRIYLEQLLLKTLRSHQRVPVETILKRLSELEDLLSEWGNKTESAPFEKVSQGARSSSLEKGPEMTPQGARSSSLEKGPEATPQGARSSSLEKSPEVTPQGARSSSLEKGPEVTPQGARSSSLEKGHEVTPQGARSSSLEKGPEATSQKGVFADPPPFQKKTSPTQDKGVPFLATPEKKKQETEQNTNLPFTKRTTKKETIQESQSNPFIQRPSFTKEQESRFDTLLQFSAVELEGKVEKHP